MRSRAKEGVRIRRTLLSDFLTSTRMDSSLKRNLQRCLCKKYKYHKLSILFPPWILNINWPQVSKTLSPSQIKAVYEKFDVNGDGKLSRKEFRKLMEREWFAIFFYCYKKDTKYFSWIKIKLEGWIFFWSLLQSLFIKHCWSYLPKLEMFRNEI